MPLRLFLGSSGDGGVDGVSKLFIISLSVDVMIFSFSRSIVFLDNPVPVCTDIYPSAPTIYVLAFV